MIRRPSSRTCTCAAARPAQARAPAASSLHSLGRDPVGGPPGDVVQHVADVEQRLPAALELDVRDVDQPGRHQGLEHGGVAKPALGLLEVGHRHVGQLARSARAASRTSSCSSGSRSRASRRQLVSIVGAQPQGEVGVAGEVPDVEQPERDPQVVGGRSTISASVRTEWSSCAPRVPQRVPDLLGHLAEVDARRRETSTTSRSEYGASSLAAVAAHRDQRDADVRAPPQSSYASMQSASAAAVRAARSAAVTAASSLGQIAASSRSPVRTRTTDSTGDDPDLAVADAAGLRRR